MLGLGADQTSQDYKRYHQDYGQLEKRAFYPPPGAIHRVSLPEDTTYTSAAQLE